MTRRSKILTALVAIVAVTAGCRTLTGKSAGANVDDTAIAASVKAKLGADKTANLTRVNVDTNNGTVYLTGVVESAEQKARAEQLAWDAQGVKGVVNNLQVQRR